jgi:carbonic anhydrase
MIRYIHASKDDEYYQASLLFQEYANWLNIDLSFQKFEEELQSLKEMYGGQKGALILGYDNINCIACIGVRQIDEGIAEFKRMYVKPTHQRKGIGKSLLYESLTFAKYAGYNKVRLDTLEHMVPAMNLYLTNGFYKIDAYYFNPEPNAVYFEKQL